MSSTAVTVAIVPVALMVAISGHGGAPGEPRRPVSRRGSWPFASSVDDLGLLSSVVVPGKLPGNTVLLGGSVLARLSYRREGTAWASDQPTVRAEFTEVTKQLIARVQ